MRRPPLHFTTEHQRRAGRKRAQMFTKEELSAAGTKGAAVRIAQESFYDHVCSIAPDGPARQRVELRARKGSRLLKPEDVHLVRLEDIQGTLGEPWPLWKKRVLLGRYIWQYIWAGLTEPPRPTQQEFFCLAARARERVGRGLALLNPLHVVGVAANDFCNADGRAYGWRNQRKLFRAALREARSYACLVQEIDDYFARVLLRQAVDDYFDALQHTVHPGVCQQVSPEPRLRVLGRRRPMNPGRSYTPPVRPPRLPIHWAPIYWLLGRPCDYTRPGARDGRANSSGLARTPAYWLPPDTPTGDESDEGEETLTPVSTVSRRGDHP